VKANELRTLRHLALSIAEQCAALLELVDGAMPTDQPAKPDPDIPAEVVDAGAAIIAASRDHMFGSARRAAEAAAGETGTIERTT